MAANATFALKPGVWFLRVRFVIFAPDSRREPSPPSRRKSTQPTVQILEASSSFDSVLELYTVDDFRQLVLTFQTSPGPGRGHHQFEHHETRGVLRQRAFHADGAMPHRREHAFDRVRGSQVVPMIGGKVEQAFDGPVV